MRRDRSELEKAILSTIVTIHQEYDIVSFQDKAISKLSDYFSRSKVIQVLNMNTRIQDLSENELFNLSQYFKDNGLMDDIKLDDYFFPEDIKEAIANKIDKNNEYEKRVVFKNVEYNENDLKPQFVLWLSYQDIAKMHDASILNYNFATQRKAGWIEYKNKYIRIPTVNETNVREIKEEILLGLFEENTLTFNIRPTKEGLWEYEPSTKALVLNPDAIIDIIDGFHRVTAIHDAWKEKPDINGKMCIIIKNIDVKKARKFIAQESKGTLNGQEEMMLYDPSSNIVKLIDMINTEHSDENILFNRIVTGNGIKDALVLHDIFAEVMNIAWYKKLNESDIEELYKIKDFLVDFYSMTYTMIKKKFEADTIDELKNNVSLNQTFISGLLFPALELYEKNNGKVEPSKIKKMVNKLEYELKDNKYTYSTQGDKYEIGRYSKAWKSAI